MNATVKSLYVTSLLMLYVNCADLLSFLLQLQHNRAFGFLENCFILLQIVKLYFVIM